MYIFKISTNIETCKSQVNDYFFPPLKDNSSPQMFQTGKGSNPKKIYKQSVYILDVHQFFLNLILFFGQIPFFFQESIFQRKMSIESYNSQKHTNQFLNTGTYQYIFRFLVKHEVKNILKTRGPSWPLIAHLKT